jgi:N-methylhydantoinase B/oxoprolinase/acetone carboxylase alpha subunit
MSTVLQRASFSPIIYDMVDYSNAIFDPNTELLGQTANCPVHIAAMHFSARASIKKFGVDNLAAGDVVVLNDPYQGGTHTPDVTFTMPIYFEDTLLGFGVSRAHWTDVGGGGAGGQAFGTHIAAEGLRLPPVKILERGELNQDLVAIIRNATRVPQYVDGDIQAQLGALKAAEIEVTRLARRYGVETLREAQREVLDYTERMTRAAVERIPDGEYEADDFADTDGFSPDPIRLHVKITVRGDQIIVDFSGTDPEAIGSINSPYANTASAVYYALKFFLNPEAPPNGGLYRAITLEIPEGTWLNPRWPAPTIGCTTLASSKVCAVIWLALAKAIPDRIIAPTYGECNWFVASAKDPATGFLSVFSDLPAGGWGGTPYHDGMNVTQDPLGNCMNLPAESAELLFPIEYEGWDLRDDSGGAGKWRGGLGSRLRIHWHGRTELSMECSRTREGAPGVNGGGASPPQRQIKIHRDGKEEAIGGWAEDGTWKNCLLANHVFQPGERFLFLSTGGGGWGDPVERDPALVLEDVLDEYVSSETARDTYGVVIADRRVDEEATARLRAERSS